MRLGRRLGLFRSQRRSAWSVCIVCKRVFAGHTERVSENCTRCKIQIQWFSLTAIFLFRQVLQPLDLPATPTMVVWVNRCRPRRYFNPACCGNALSTPTSRRNFDPESFQIASFPRRLGYGVELHSHGGKMKMEWIEAEARSYAKPKRVVILRTAPTHSTFPYFFLLESLSCWWSSLIKG